MGNTSIKSKERVSKLGEVYTPDWIVNRILDLNKDKSYELTTRYLEPSCGNGNFLVAILDRKLKALKNDGKLTFKNVAIGVSNIYGIDIMFDNICESKERMLSLIASYIKLEKEQINVIKYIMNRNIIWGNTLTKEAYRPNSSFANAIKRFKEGKQVSNSKRSSILKVAEWSFTEQHGIVYVERTDFYFVDLDVPIKQYDTIELDSLHKQVDMRGWGDLDEYTEQDRDRNRPTDETTSEATSCTQMGLFEIGLSEISYKFKRLECAT